MAKDDKDHSFEEATRFDPQRSLRVAAEHEAPARKTPNPNLVKTTIDLVPPQAAARAQQSDSTSSMDFAPETLNPDDFTPMPPPDNVPDAATDWGPLYLDDEVLGSQSMNVKMGAEDARFFKAATMLSPSRPQQPSQPAPVALPSSTYPPRSRPERPSQPAGIRVERARESRPSAGVENKSIPEQIRDIAPDPNRFLSPEKIRSELVRSERVDPKLIEGSRIGNYEIIRQIGQGGMGVVYEGRHLLLPRRVAIKFLLTNQSHDEDQIRRFLGEAVAAAHIGHKGVVDIYDYGYDKNNSAYLVMEYVDGQTLQSIMKRSGQLPVPMVLRVVRDIADVLAAAHQSGIVHRDLKPDNVVLARDEHGKDFVKVLDFGVAKFVNAQSLSGKTQAGSILGTPWYMPPEQCQGFLTVDYRSDIYALGCVFYQMVCGKVPFAGSLRDVLIAHIHMDPPSPRALNPSIPSGVEQLILHMMAKEPGDRPTSMEQVSRVLGEFAEPVPNRTRDDRNAVSLGHGGASHRKRWVAPVVAATIAGIATAAAFFFLQ